MLIRAVCTNIPPSSTVRKNFGKSLGIRTHACHVYLLKKLKKFQGLFSLRILGVGCGHHSLKHHFLLMHFVKHIECSIYSGNKLQPSPFKSELHVQTIHQTLCEHPINSRFAHAYWLELIQYQCRMEAVFLAQN